MRLNIASKILRSNSLKHLFLFCVAAMITNCDIRRSDRLTSEKDSLIHKIAKSDANVKIANSNVFELTSKYTTGVYDIYVSYPSNYRNTGNKYPVLIVLDAEVNFGAVSYIVQRLIKDKLIPELLVVGVAYQGETDEDTYYSLRCRDYTPTIERGFEQAHKNYKSGSGGAENFTKFLSLELFPHLASYYPARNDNRTIYGHSFGGLFGAHLLLHHSDLFDNYLLLSPSLWWDNKTTLTNARSNPSINANQLKLYVGTGALEDHMVDDHLEMVNTLMRFNSENKIKIKSEILENETHRTIFGRGFTNGLRFIYAKTHSK